MGVLQAHHPHNILKILHFDCVLRSKILKLILFFDINFKQTKINESHFCIFWFESNCVVLWNEKGIIQDSTDIFFILLNLTFLLTNLFSYPFVFIDSTPAWRNSSTTYCISSAPRLSQRTNATAWRAFGGQKTTYYSFRK